MDRRNIDMGMVESVAIAARAGESAGLLEATAPPPLSWAQQVVAKLIALVALLILVRGARKSAPAVFRATLIL
jgi:hypothetical protein